MKRLKTAAKIAVVVIVGAVLGTLATRGVFFWADWVIGSAPQPQEVVNEDTTSGSNELDDIWEVLEVHSAALVPDLTPEPNFTDLVQTSLKGVVHLSCPSWQGSGFVVGPRLIVTARHCVEGVEDFLITTHDGHQVRATRAISDKEHDVAFIWVDDLRCTDDEHFARYPCGKVMEPEHEVKLHPLPIGPIKDCRLGQNVYVIGSPYGKTNFNALSVGVISGVDRDWNNIGGYDYGWEVAFTVDSAGAPGNSGCPVFTTDGVVRGVLVGGFNPVLIGVMPCDLFLGDLESIRLMFLMDRYECEKISDMGEWYNNSTDNEYY